ncbi:probable RNA-dependent RNA polymerase 3 isoform X2 [Prosopis cineraria]|uniref:probable RNA-dependent RNA polymerase 3 isoform X2 n=1 Tax=Prosopis cineraria TaxID=364024 RepID=UPI00240F5B32|nr:probable RNA-dependent RNA polymerase 3 isoform X2 [Prosopis cineraria]
MINPTEYVALSDSVERLLDSICREQNQAPPSPQVRRELASVGEELALDILTRISLTKVRHSLASFIIFMIRSPKKVTSRSPNAIRGFATNTLLNTQANGAATPTPMEEHPGSTSPAMSPELVALGELEFRKAFLLLSYIGEESLERAITADKIRSLKMLPMCKFEEEIWQAAGRRYISPNDRRLYHGWDSGKPYVYHCHISQRGSLKFKGPLFQEARTHLQKSLGDDNVIVVNFAEERNGYCRTSVEEAYALYNKFGREGICVGLRLYRFFVFKDGGKEEKKKDPTSSSVKCYFVRTESCASVDKKDPYKLSGKSMLEARSLFMQAHTLPSLDKFMARFSLILSKTFTLDIDMGSLDVQTIEDVCCQDENGDIVYHNGKEQIHTDGTGFISKDLAVLCPRNVSKGIHTKDKNFRDNTTMAFANVESSTFEPPLLIQCRLFHIGRAMKGTLLINEKLPPQTIQVRPSMIKVHADPNFLVQSINSMEVVGTSNKPQRCYLSRNLIALLSYGGVPNEFFMGLLKSALEDAYCVFTNKRAAFRVSLKHGEMDDDFNSMKMILSGIPLDEAYLQYRLSVLAKEEINGLKKGRLYIPECYYLMGTADPTGCLKKDQVCIILENGQISGDVLVYRNPGLHFGDIHILEATYVKELESFVGHSKYAIFFPCVGPRSLADEIAGGDFDGDMYWVSKNAELLKYFKKSEPWIENPPCDDVIASKQPSTLSDDELQDELFKLFLRSRFQPSYAMGVAAECWNAFMDRLLTLRDDCPIEKQEKERVKENMIKLIDLYYYALDAPKKGGKKVEVPKDLRAEIYPHYMEKDSSYTSTSILGLIYDEVNKCQYEDVKDITKLPILDAEIPESCLNMWRSYYGQYRSEMTAALNGSDSTGQSKAAIYNKYREILYGASEPNKSRKSMEQVYNEALAVYHVAYDYAKSIESVSKCGFVWKVAGPVLLQHYASKQDISALMREIFGW